MLLRQIVSLVITLIKKVKSIKHIKHLVISNMKAGLFVQYRKHFQINTKYKFRERALCHVSPFTTEEKQHCCSKLLD